MNNFFEQKYNSSSWDHAHSALKVAVAGTLFILATGAYVYDLTIPMGMKEAPSFLISLFIAGSAVSLLTPPQDSNGLKP